MTDYEKLKAEYARNFLEQSQRARIRAANLRAEMTEDVLDGVGAIDYSRPQIMASPSPDGVHNLALRLIDKKEHGLERLQRLESTIADAEHTLDGVSGLAGTVLRLRYWQDANRKVIALYLRTTTRRVRELELAGLLEAYEALPDGAKIPLHPAQE